MKALAIDSAVSAITFTAVNEKKNVRITIDTGMHQSEELLPGIQYVMEKTGLTPDNLEFTTLSMGPGSFTGLRLAFSALKAFSLSNNVPIYGIETLEAHAYPYKEWKGAVLPCIDAKKNRFYTQVYRNGSALTEILDIEIADIEKLLDKEEPILVVGPDASFFAEELRSCNPTLDITVFSSTKTTTKTLLELAQKKYEIKEKSLEEYDGPLYVRKSEAELHLLKKV